MRFYFRLQFSRYAFLTLGITYGFVRERRLAASELVLRAEEAKVLALRSGQLAIERTKAAEGDPKAGELRNRYDFRLNFHIAVERAAIAILSR